MKSYQDMLKDILSSSGWSQQQLAARLGVSFPTVNYWLNNKVTPRPSMLDRIKNLYIARDIPYDGPEYITLMIQTGQLKVGDEVLLFKTFDETFDGYEVIGIERRLYESSTGTNAKAPNTENITIPVASIQGKVAQGTKPGYRIYEKINPGAFARVMFIVDDLAIAVVEDWGLDIGQKPTAD